MNELTKLNNKTVVVTGASGYIGAELTNALLNQGCKLIRVSRKNLPLLNGANSITGDIRDAKIWSTIVTQADIIYHLAGNTSVYEAEKYPVYSLNSTLLPINHLIEACSYLKRVPRVVYASTATVYGLTKKVPVNESRRANPITIYDIHKIFAEQQIKMATLQNLIKGVCLRLSNVYGPSKGLNSASERGVLNKISSMALRDNKLLIYGHGNYIRDYVYISDVIRAFLLAGVCDKVCGGSFNIASGIGTTVRQAFQIIADEVEAITGYPVEMKHSSWPIGSNPIEYRNFIADIKKYSTLTGWSPAIDFKKGVSQLIKEQREKI